MVQHFRVVGLGSELKVSHGQCIGPFLSLLCAPTLHYHHHNCDDDNVGYQLDIELAQCKCAKCVEHKNID